MPQQIYWHAPLWEVLLIVSSGLLLISWLFMRAWRRPDIADVLAHLHPALNEQPLFFFNATVGIQPLNRAGRQLILQLADKQQPLQSEVITDIAFEAMIEGRQAVKKAWPEAHQTLLAIPFNTASNKVTDLLLVVFSEVTPPQSDLSANLAEKVVLPPLPPPVTVKATGEAEHWLTLGNDVKIHPHAHGSHQPRAPIAFVRSATKHFRECDLAATDSPSNYVCSRSPLRTRRATISLW